MAQDKLTKKTHLFKSLDRLSNDDTHSAEREDQSMLSLDMPEPPSSESVRLGRRPSEAHVSKRDYSPQRRSSPALFSSSPRNSPSRDKSGRPVSDPSNIIKATKPFRLTEIVRDTPLRPNAANQGNQFPESSPGNCNALKSAPPPQPALPKAGSKRKRGKERANQIPEELKMFKGLKFFFFPNSDIAPDRRRRIAKVIEYGGSRMEEFGPEVTHLVFDNRVDYSELFQWTDIREVPSGTIVVNSMYAPDCVAFKRLLNPDQAQYYPQGAPKTNKAAPISRGISPSSGSSLPVKLSRKKRLIVDQQTPPREEEDSPPRPDDNVRPAQVNRPETGNETEQSHDDQLDEAVAEAKTTKHLPIDSDEEDSSPPTSAQAEPEDESKSYIKSPQERPSKYPKHLKNPNWQNAFQCMQPPSSSSVTASNKIDNRAPANPANAEIISVLQQMSDYYDSTRDQWRTFAYRKAITVLRKHPMEIFTADQAAQLPCIGTRLAAKIEEIKVTHRLRRLENAQLEPTDKALKVFTKIYGVGYIQAMRWIQAGHRTLGDLEKHNVTLTDNQKIGIQHYEDFLTRIPREEVARHGAVVEETLLGIDNKFQVTVMGSYRRGAKDCGDIDVVITRPGVSITYTRNMVLDRLVPKLFAKGFLKVGLAVTSRDDGTKWHGASQLPSSSKGGGPAPWRRIDFLLVPWSERGAAIIYFTGNDIFNRSLRLLARKKGMRLNQRGLYRDVLRGRHQAKLTDGVKIAGEEEKDVFQKLGVPWRECWERDL